MSKIENIENYHPNGKLKEKSVFNDEKQYWLITEWYENGQKKSEGTSKDNKIYEFLTEWYENGQKKTELGLDSIDGKLNGSNRRWYENGQIEFEQTYKNNNLILSKMWDKDGTLKYDVWNPPYDIY
jgi:antitoxin component YwqK of YwqJK toxin-antitoxin module